MSKRSIQQSSLTNIETLLAKSKQQRINENQITLGTKTKKDTTPYSPIQTRGSINPTPDSTDRDQVKQRKKASISLDNNNFLKKSQQAQKNQKWAYSVIVDNIISDEAKNYLNNDFENYNEDYKKYQKKIEKTLKKQNDFNKDDIDAQIYKSKMDYIQLSTLGHEINKQIKDVKMKYINENIYQNKIKKSLKKNVHEIFSTNRTNTHDEHNYLQQIFNIHKKYQQLKNSVHEAESIIHSSSSSSSSSSSIKKPVDVDVREQIWYQTGFEIQNVKDDDDTLDKENKKMYETIIDLAVKTLDKDVSSMTDDEIEAFIKEYDNERINLIKKTMEESDKQIHYIYNDGESDADIKRKAKDKPSEIQQLSSPLGLKYMNKNINGGISVYKDSVYDVSEQKIIVGSKYDKSIREVKKVEEKYIKYEKEKPRLNIIKGDKHNIINNNNENASILSSSTLTQAASEILLNLVNSHSELKKGIEDLLTAKMKDAPKLYRNLLYETCRLRPTTAEDQIVDSGESRKISTLGVNEKTQFSDIWGKEVFNYASGNYDDAVTKCYICKNVMVPFSEKVTWGQGSQRSCSEMEHTMPCITAYTQAPVYFLLEGYKHGTSNYLKLWKNFTNTTNILEHLYIAINEEDDFDGDKINLLFSELKGDFKTYCEKPANGGKVDKDVFNWLFEVIKYWLFEFSYAHHICNQVKSNRDIADVIELNKYLDNIEERWNTPKDNIDRAEKYKVYGEGEERVNISRTLIEENLKARFDMMKKFSGEKGEGGTIREYYLKVTNVPLELFENNKDDIMKVMVAKGLVMMYKYYRKQKYKRSKKGRGGTRRKRRIGGTRKMKMRMKMKKSTLKKSNKRKTRRKQ